MLGANTLLGGVDFLQGLASDLIEIFHN